jgi:glutamine amidotransferase
MFIVHVRAATVGDLTEANAHPWRAEALGREWVFAHNGTVQELERLDTGRFAQEGETDSEQAFHHLLTRLERRVAPSSVLEGARASDRLSDTALAAEILAVGRELSERDSRVNFLLSDGTTLFAYHDGHKTLHVLEKHASDLGAIGMADADYRLDLRVGNAAEERAVIVASVPLTDEPGWQKLAAGEFLVIRGGRVTRRVAPEGTL